MKEYIIIFIWPLIWSFFAVLFVDGIKYFVEKYIKATYMDWEKILKILQSLIYPFLTIIIGILLGIFIGVEGQKRGISIMVYFGLVFFNYKIGYKIIINKIKEWLKNKFNIGGNL